MVNQYILKEIIIKINDVHKTIGEALEVIPDDNVRLKLSEIYDELGKFAERVVNVLNGSSSSPHPAVGEEESR